VLALSPSQRARFIEGFLCAEGWVSNTPTGTKLRRFIQADGPKQDAMALAIYLAGHFPRLHRIPASGQARAKADIRITRPDVGGERLVREELDPGPVWCATTGLGSWTAMQDGQVFLTGSSLA
jgi:hypothetical protein